MKLRPSNKALSEIKSALGACGGEATAAQLAELTGYSVQVVKAASKLLATKPTREQSPPRKPDRVVPVFIKEIQKNTGLECLFEKSVRTVEQWILITPTGVPIMRLVGKGDLLQFARAIKEPTKVMQGITSLEIQERREARARRKNLE